MADAIVSVVFEKLSTIIAREVEQEVRLVAGVRPEVEKMKHTFRTIQAVLEDAENRQHRKDGKAVKLWLDELKHISYDIEDVLDEWNTAILKSKIERDNALVQTPPTSSLLSKVRSCIPSPCSCFTGLAQRHHIAVKIEELNVQLQAIAKKRNDFSFAVGLNSNTDPKLDQRPKTTSLIDESDVCGRDHDKDTLIHLLLSDNNGDRGSGGNGIPLFAIVGMGGLGKTTLAQLAFNNDEVKKHFPVRIWVCVSDPFDEVRIAKAILESLKGSPSSFNELESLLQEIRQKIEGKKFLLVLDDVWTEDEKKWEPLKLSLCLGSKESKIIVTTRKEKVATMMHCSRPLISPSVLSDEDSWSLFCKIAFFGRSKEDCENLNSIGRQFVKKCGGLPLAIKTVASLLRFKGTREQWQRILDSEKWKLEDEIFENLYAPLLLSYYDLPMSEKQCFRYCAIFPKDHKIKRDELIKLWMAQGFLGERNEFEMMGEECFDNLAIRGFFQEFEKDEVDGRVIGCKMHDIVHDFAQFLAKTECLLVEEQRLAESFPENVRYLTIIPQPDNHAPIIDGIKGVDKLRSFLFHCDGDVWKSNAYVPKLFHQLISLRMLGLSYSQLEVPIEIGKLIHLRYLDLEGNEGLEELPETLCDLCNLQSLNIRRCCCLHRLPSGMERIINLRHLLNADAYRITMPIGMQRLTSLQTLEEFRVSSSSDSFSLVDLGNLIHLRGNLFIGRLGKVREASEARLSTMAGLRSLTLDFYDGDFDKEPQKRIEDDALILQALQPPPQLQSLDINFCQSLAFPSWIMLLISLKSVTISHCTNWESLPPLGKLPLLESLTIDGMDKVKKVGDEFLGIEASPSSSSINHIDFTFFPNLKKLYFNDMDEWKEWGYGYEKQLVLRSRGGGEVNNSSSNTIPSIMPKLESLFIKRCHVLQTLPHHLLQSTTLQRLTIMKSRAPRECFKDLPSVSHIPQFYID